MGMIADLKEYLIGQGVDTPIFLAQMPSTPDECLTLFQYAGQERMLEAGLDVPGLQVRSRAVDYETALANLSRATNILADIGNEFKGVNVEGVVIDGVRYLRVVPSQSAFPMGLDQNQRHELVQNFYVVKESN